MIFDMDKIEKIETEIITIFKSCPPNIRCGKIIYSPCFKTLFSFQKAKNIFSNKYIVYTIKEILNSDSYQKPHNIFTKILSKILCTALGFIPIMGSYISLSILLAGITKDIIHDKDINDIKKYLNKNWKQHKRFRKVKYIIYVDDTSALSKKELSCLHIISFLISNKYLVNTAMLLGQPSNCKLQHMSNCTVINEYKAELILSSNTNIKDDDTINNLAILDIIGVENAEKLNYACEINVKQDKTVEAIVQSIYEANNIQVVDKLEKFLNSCSILFEQFDLKDVEYVSKLQNNSLYARQFELAKKAEIIQEINFQKFYFLQPFLREYYQNKKYVFPSNFYNFVYNYLKQEYPDQYDDLAIAASMLLTDNNEILAQNILAYYYKSYTMPLYKLILIEKTLEKSELGANIILIDKYYNEQGQDVISLRKLCNTSLEKLYFSQIDNQSKLAALSFISRLYYELDIDQKSLLEISRYYRELLSKINIFSEKIFSNYNFALDYIVFSTCIEDDYQSHYTAQKLVELIKNADISKLSRDKYLKYLRLGNAIYPGDTKSAKEILQKGYELSKKNYYTNTLFGINYSSTLIIEGQYNDAANILEPIIKYRLKNNIINLSAQNNYIIARYLLNQISAKKAIKQLLPFCINNRQSDNCICENNYVSLKIMSGANDFSNEIEICAKIMQYNDEYHTFYARHNIIIIYFLTKDDKFWEFAEACKIPYLIKYYEPIYREKVTFLKENFRKKWDINELTKELNKHFQSVGLDNITIFHKLPTLFGLIERWFE